jgi:hypothetical protein
MTTWAVFAAAEPELASDVSRAFAARKHATMATIRADGSPRISGTEVDVGDDGEFYVAMMPGTRRAADLRRDPRIAVHSPTIDPPEDPTQWVGEGKLAGIAIETAPDRFRLDVDQVAFQRIVAGKLEIRYWSADAGLRVATRD